MKPSHLAFVIAIGLILGTGAMDASTWTGGNGNWSSNAAVGWNGTGVPNAVGAVADHAVSTTTVTTQDISAGGGVTVGTISLTNNSNNSWSFTLTNPLTLNQDGASAGKVTISNTNTNTGTTNFLAIGNAGAGTITLADDLLISNTGGSTNATGAIQIAGILGGTGNITLSNNTNSTAAGVIRFVTGVNTFTGTVLVQKGATTFNKAESFGNVAGNTITLGQSGQGSATLVSTAGVTLPNNVVVASGSGGTLVLGSTSTANAAYSGTFNLNGDVSLTSLSTAGTSNLTFSGIISGAGNLTKIGAGGVALTAANTFTGDTLVSAGPLKLGNNLALQNSALDTSGAGTVNVTGFTTPTFGGLKGSTNLAAVVSTGYTTVTALTLNPGSAVTNSYSGIIADGAVGMTLTKTGAGTQVLSGANSYTGATLISDGTLALGSTGSIDNTSSISLGTVGTFDVSAKSGGYTVGTLKGSGSVTGALTVSTQLAIGNSPGTTNFSSNLTLGSSSTYLYDMTGGISPGVGSADLGNVTGTLTISGGAILDLVELGTYTVGNKFTLFGYTGGISGTFAGLADDTTFLDDLANTWLINYDDTSAGTNGGTGTGFVTITAVPEPAAALLGAVGLIGLLRRRR